MANGNGITSGVIDTASKMIVQVGFPVVVAAVLLWFLLTKFQDNMLIITDRMAKNTEAADSLVKHQAALVEQEKIIYAELREQTGSMKAQAALIGQIATDSHTLVDINKNRLDTIKAILEQQKGHTK